MTGDVRVLLFPNCTSIFINVNLDVLIKILCELLNVGNDLNDEI